MSHQNLNTTNSIKCPICTNGTMLFNIDSASAEGPDDNYTFSFYRCVVCFGIFSKFLTYSKSVPGNRKEEILFPKSIARDPISKHVPEPYRNDFIEACLVLTDSPKASAAISRRCLQSILRNELKVPSASLDSEIQYTIEHNLLSANILEDIDSVRSIGNFSAHETKSKSSGEIIDVEPGEAEWNLEVLEEIFDYVFVRPALSKEKRNAWNEKLADAGKPPLKTVKS